jgi:hypothetical protein
MPRSRVDPDGNLQSVILLRMRSRGAVARLLARLQQSGAAR